MWDKSRGYFNDLLDVDRLIEARIGGTTLMVLVSFVSAWHLLSSNRIVTSLSTQVEILCCLLDHLFCYFEDQNLVKRSEAS
jgi:hypothetical protein